MHIRNRDSDAVAMSFAASATAAMWTDLLLVLLVAGVVRSLPHPPVAHPPRRRLRVHSSVCSSLRRLRMHRACIVQNVTRHEATACSELHIRQFRPRHMVRLSLQACRGDSLRALQARPALLRSVDL